MVASAGMSYCLSGQRLSGILNDGQPPPGQSAGNRGHRQRGSCMLDSGYKAMGYKRHPIIRLSAASFYKGVAQVRPLNGGIWPRIFSLTGACS